MELESMSDYVPEQAERANRAQGLCGCGKPLPATAKNPTLCDECLDTTGDRLAA